MNKQFVSYEIAKRVKELGFSDDCFGYYTPDGTYLREIYLSKKGQSTFGNLITSPLWQQVTDWLLSPKVLIEIRTIYSWDCWSYDIILEDTMSPFFVAFNGMLENIEFKTYYECREQAILKALDIIKERSKK